MLGPETRALVEERCGEKEAVKLRRAPTLVLATAVLSGDALTDAEDLHATACAVYAVLLGATERGLASYWRTPAAFAEPAVREALRLGDDERVVALIHLGPKVSEPPEKERRAARRRAQRPAVVRAHGEEQRWIELAGLVERLQQESALEQRVQEGGERQVVDADARPDPGLREVPGLRLPAGEAVFGMQQGRLTGAPLDRRRSEARMDAEVDERPAGPEHAPGFREGRARIIEIGVGEDRDDGVERGVVEREPMCVGAHEALDDRARVLLGDSELVGGDVDCRDRPAGLDQERDRPAGAAPEVETAPRPVDRAAGPRLGARRRTARTRRTPRTTRSGRRTVLIVACGREESNLQGPKPTGS